MTTLSIRIGRFTLFVKKMAVRKMVVKVQINSKIELFLCLLLQSVPINKRFIIRDLRDVYIGRTLSMLPMNKRFFDLIRVPPVQKSLIECTKYLLYVGTDCSSMKIKCTENVVFSNGMRNKLSWQEN